MKRFTMTLALTALFAFAFTSCDDSEDLANPDLSKIEAQANGSGDDDNNCKSCG